MRHYQILGFGKMTYSVLMTQIVNESWLFGSKPKIAKIKVMTSQTLLMTLSVKSFDRKFENECLTKRNFAPLREY